MRSPRVRRPVCALLVLALVHGCGATEVNEHRTRGAPPSVTVRPYWTDSFGERRVVGGLEFALLRAGGGAGAEVARGRTDGTNPLVFQDVAPGPYELVYTLPGCAERRERVELPPRRRVTVRIDVQAAEAESRPMPQGPGNTPSDAGGPGGTEIAAAIGDGVVFVLRVVGGTVLVVTLVGLLVLAAAVEVDAD